MKTRWRKVAAVSLGCAKNRIDTEEILGSWAAAATSLPTTRRSGCYYH